MEELGLPHSKVRVIPPPLGRPRGFRAACPSGRAAERRHPSPPPRRRRRPRNTIRARPRGVGGAQAWLMSSNPACRTRWHQRNRTCTAAGTFTLQQSLPAQSEDFCSQIPVRACGGAVHACGWAVYSLVKWSAGLLAARSVTMWAAGDSPSMSER